MNAPGGKMNYGVAMRALFFILSAFALPGRVMLRSRFGVRAMSVSMITSSFLVTSALAWILTSSGMFGPNARLDLWPMLFVLVTTVGASIHSFIAERRLQKGVLLHSRYNGDSHLAELIPVQEAVIQRFLEPLFLLTAGGLLVFAGMNWGWLVVAVGAGMFVYEQVLAHYRREFFLDLLDSMIEAQAAQDSVKSGLWKDDGRPKEQDTTLGVVVGVPPRPKEDAYAARVAESMENAFPSTPTSSYSKWNPQAGRPSPNAEGGPGTPSPAGD